MALPTVKMVWTGPRKKFSGRRTYAQGDTIDVSRLEARTFKALGWAADAPAQVQENPMPATEQPDPLEALRAEYQTAVGRRAYHGWDADQLRAKIEQSRQGGLYNRRDMRPEE